MQNCPDFRKIKELACVCLTRWYAKHTCEGTCRLQKMAPILSQCVKFCQWDQRNGKCPLLGMECGVVLCFISVISSDPGDLCMMTSSNGSSFRVTGPLCGEFTEFPTQRPVVRTFDVSFDLHLNRRLSKQSWDWWFEMPSSPLLRHCNVIHLSWILAPRNRWHMNKSFVWYLTTNNTRKR